ncbi:uncharacterized protein LOC135207744 isoform X1 [Macrobrachium nipponense]|uniref:uncharacterized protein LOC135207744 isoform X1 n=1 Tax=Macrobrachium nipponense TaxID=159736 RepID=UPI0030C7D506
MKLDGRMEESEIADKTLSFILATAVSLVREKEEEEDEVVGLNSSLFNASADVVEALMNSSGTGAAGDKIVRHLPPLYEVLIAGCYFFGITGNLAAFYIITKNETQRGRKQTFMLQCLAGNDLLALLGSCVQMFMHLYLPVAKMKWFCAFRVVWRAFGLGSGCVSVVMAVDRWLALSQPFLYHERVTYAVICRSVIGLWVFNLMLVCAPFVGFGLWYDVDSDKGVTACVRYRHGITPVDRAYAFLVFAFGMTMCAVIVRCNISVIRELFLMRKDCMPRRHSRSSCRSSTSLGGPPRNHPTMEELSLSRLMVVISIFFVVCWVPQLVTIILAQLEGTIPRIEGKWYRIADVFVAMNFAFDPYVYVILRRQRRCGNRHVRKLASYICPMGFKGPNSSFIHSSSRSHNSNNSNSYSRNSQLEERDNSIVMKVRNPKPVMAVSTRYPSIAQAVKRSMYPSISFCHPHLLTPHSQSNPTLCSHSIRITYHKFQTLNRLQSLKKKQSSPPVQMVLANEKQVNGANVEVQNEVIRVNQIADYTEAETEFTIFEDESTMTTSILQNDEHSPTLLIGRYVKSKSLIPLPENSIYSDSDDDARSVKTNKRWSFCYGQDVKCNVFWRESNSLALERKWFPHSWHQVVFPRRNCYSTFHRKQFRL